MSPTKDLIKLDKVPVQTEVENRIEEEIEPKIIEVEEVKTIEVARAFEGETFGELALLQRKKRTTSAEAATAVHLVTLEKEMFEEIMSILIN